MNKTDKTPYLGDGDIPAEGDRQETEQTGRPCGREMEAQAGTLGSGWLGLPSLQQGRPRFAVEAKGSSGQEADPG